MKDVQIGGTCRALEGGDGCIQECLEGRTTSDDQGLFGRITV